MAYGYDTYDTGGYGYGGSGGDYQVVYGGPYFIHLTDQLSGAGSSAYERLHTASGTYIRSSSGLDQTSYAYEGQDGSIYQHATNSIGGIQPYSGGTPYYNPETGSPSDSLYQTYTSRYSSDGSDTQSDVTTTTYTTKGFGLSGRGPVDHAYASNESIKDHDGGSYVRNTYARSATYYTSGAVEQTALNSYSEFYDGHTVPYSIFQTGYRSYTDPDGYTTTSYIDTRHGPD